MFTGIQGRISILQGYMTHSANDISSSVAQCSLSWLHIIYQSQIRQSFVCPTSGPLPWSNSTTLRRFRGRKSQFHTEWQGSQLAGDSWLCTLKQCMLPAPEILNLDSTGLYWAPLFCTITHRGLRHQFNTKHAFKCEISFAQLHRWAARKHPAGSTADNMKCRVLSRAAVKGLPVSMSWQDHLLRQMRQYTMSLEDEAAKPSYQA